MYKHLTGTPYRGRTTLLPGGGKVGVDRCPPKSLAQAVKEGRGVMHHASCMDDDGQPLGGFEGV